MQTSATCFRAGCSRPVITSFRHESLCLEHFCSKSYEFLNSVDQHIQSNFVSPACSTEQLRVADECSRKALDICLSKMILNNLDRARLLDILLWSGDIMSSSGKTSPASAKDGYKARYQGPQIRRLATGDALSN